MRARPRPLPLVLLALAAAVLVSCSDDEDGSGPCADLATAVLQPVAYVDPDEDEYGDVPAMIERGDDIAAALERLGDDLPADLRPAVEDLAVLYAHGPDEPGDDQVVAAFERLVGWAVGACEVDGPVWRCSDRSTFHSAEELGPPEDTDTERVLVTDDDDRMLFAWLDEDGLAVRAETAVPDGDGWRPDLRSICLS